MSKKRDREIEAMALIMEQAVDGELAKTYAGGTFSVRDAMRFGYAKAARIIKELYILTEATPSKLAREQTGTRPPVPFPKEPTS
jgi:hypothetical protein